MCDFNISCLCLKAKLQFKAFVESIPKKKIVNKVCFCKFDKQTFNSHLPFIDYKRYLQSN